MQIEGAKILFLFNFEYRVDFRPIFSSSQLGLNSLRVEGSPAAIPHIVYPSIEKKTRSCVDLSRTTQVAILEYICSTTCTSAKYTCRSCVGLDWPFFSKSNEDIYVSDMCAWWPHTLMERSPIQQVPPKSPPKTAEKKEAGTPTLTY